MKLSIFRFICCAFLISISGCNNKGAPAPAPTNVVVVAGDTAATVTWDMVPGVQYFGWWAPGTSLSPAGCAAIPACLAATNVSSPYVISNLVNGTTYVVTINGRTNGGAGGPGSPALTVTPRLAGTGLVGASWTAGSAGSFALRGVIAGTGTGGTGVQYVAAGDSGALFRSTDGTSWSALSNPLPSVNLNAVTDSGAVYLAAGAGGEILYSPDYAVTWTAQTSGTANNLNALYGYTTGLFIAVGDSGTILTSGNGVTWTTQTSGTVSSLRGISYGVANGIGTYVAVGDSGKLLTSTNAVNWSPNTTTTVPADNYKSVAYGVVTTAGITFPVAGTQISLTVGGVAVLGTPVFVIVGNDGGTNGVVLYSTDGQNWTRTLAAATGASYSLNAVTFGNQFIAVDSSGNIFTSANGETWGSTPTQTATAGLSAIAHTTSPSVTYSAVGAGGLTMYAK